jgi:HEAT repeat protein
MPGSTDARDVLKAHLDDGDPVVREAAARTLEAQADPKVVEALALADGPAARRRAAAFALARCAGPGAGATMQKLLGDTDPTVRWLAISTLGRLRLEAAAQSIAALLDRDPDEHVREEAARVLGLLGLPFAAGPLAGALRDDSSSHVREEAAASLGRLGVRSIVSQLRPALHDRHAAVRRAAAAAIAALELDPDGAPQAV